MDSRVTPLDLIKSSINEGKGFLLVGGAGSGKTETLKQTLEFFASDLPLAKVACITHTNLAVDEIRSRVGGSHTISTIHSFFHNLTKSFQETLHKEIATLFAIPDIPDDLASTEVGDSAAKKRRFELYKKAWMRYSKLQYILSEEKTKEHLGKRDFDKQVQAAIEALLQKLNALHIAIESHVKSIPIHSVRYNETRFDNLRELTFGHDGLIALASRFVAEYPLFRRIIQDRYDYILIDEFQDTEFLLLSSLLEKVATPGKTVIGLFGDPMQAIYNEKMSSISIFASEYGLVEIKKPDNFRSSEQVIKFINNHRTDSLRQEVALRVVEGKTETIEMRQGLVKLYYAMTSERPGPRNSPEEKRLHGEKVIKLVKAIEKRHQGLKKLVLTNKAIANEIGFAKLYSIFDARFTEVKEEIQSELGRLQLLDLAAIYSAYINRKYCYVLAEVKKGGFALTKGSDKERLSRILEQFNQENLSGYEALELAFAEKLIMPSEAYKAFRSHRETLLAELREDKEYQTFKGKYQSGISTFSKMKKSNSEIDRFDFNKMERKIKKEGYLESLFSKELKFKEIIKFLRFLNGEEEYLTMHMTKGAGIENILVILEEYYWRKYSFANLFLDKPEANDTFARTKKLFYVACSRAKRNLLCARILTESELVLFKKHFPAAEEILLK